jgi:hypothetical protein
MSASSVTLPEKRLAKPTFYLIFGYRGIFAALVGYGYTYLASIASGGLAVPMGAHIRGAFSAIWIMLYALQSTLIHRRRFRYHRQLGYFGALILLGFTLSLFSVGNFVVVRDLQQGNVDFAYNQLIGVLTSGLWVLILGLLGVYFRKHSRMHKSLIFLATVVILWPAWARWRHYFSGMSYSEWWFGVVVPYVFIPLAWLYEKRKTGKVHPVLVVVGCLIILEGTLTGLFQGSQGVQTFTKWFYHLFV